MAETVALNRKARHNYLITDTFEAGIVLTGTEIKSVRAGKANLSDAYARVERREAWLVGAHIAPYEAASYLGHLPRRPKDFQRLLLSRRAGINLRAVLPVSGEQVDASRRSSRALGVLSRDLFV